jgi:predicted DNA-binding WGR domain protein
MQTVIIHHAEYIDDRSNTDKFYRIFVVASAWVTQYGRNGTIGTFTKPTQAASADAALKAATAKLDAKVKKGYNPTSSGTVSTTALTEITEDTLEILDALAQSLPQGQSVAITAEPINAVDLGPDKASNITIVASTALSPLPSITPRSVDLTPELSPRPMLASVQPETTVDNTMLDEQWVAQYKYDGD